MNHSCFHILPKMMLAAALLGLCFALFMGTTEGQVNVQSASFVHSGPISVSEVNGVSQYRIDGILLDLSRAKIVGENKEIRVLKPYEVPAARVTVYKNRNAITIDYKGYHFESSQNGQVIRQWTT